VIWLGDEAIQEAEGDGDWLVADLDQINLRAMVLLQQMLAIGVDGYNIPHSLGRRLHSVHSAAKTTLESYFVRINLTSSTI